MTSPKTERKLKRFFRQRFGRAVFTGSAAGAHLRNLGNGTLVYSENALKFYLEKGRLIKQKIIVKEIPIVDIESMTKEANELSITWKGITDRFVIKNAELAKIVYEKTNEALKEYKKTIEEQEAAKQAQKDLTRTLSVAPQIVDSLFDVLRSLQGRVNWTSMKKYARRSEEDIRSLAEQKTTSMNMEFAQLLSAIKEHKTEAISKEAYRLLESFHEYFQGLTSENVFLAQMHPNYQDAKTTIRTYYTLNDLILATIVKDEKISEEIDQLEIMLGTLSKQANLSINVDGIVNTINKLSVENGKETAIAECREVFKQQLKPLITLELPTPLDT